MSFEDSVTPFTANGVQYVGYRNAWGNVSISFCGKSDEQFSAVRFSSHRNPPRLVRGSWHCRGGVCFVSETHLCVCYSACRPNSRSARATYRRVIPFRLNSTRQGRIVCFIPCRLNSPSQQRLSSQTGKTCLYKRYISSLSNLRHILSLADERAVAAGEFSLTRCGCFPQRCRP